VPWTAEGERHPPTTPLSCASLAWVHSSPQPFPPGFLGLLELQTACSVNTHCIDGKNGNDLPVQEGVSEVSDGGLLINVRIV
jgi:hypothetical protein